MEQKNKGLDSAFGSVSMEGIKLSPDMVEMVQKALDAEKHDKSFLYELAKLIQEKKEHEFRKK